MLGVKLWHAEADSRFPDVGERISYALSEEGRARLAELVSNPTAFCK